MPSRDPTTLALEARRARGVQVGIALVVLVVVLRFTPLTSNLFLFSVIENLAYDSTFDRAQPQPPVDLVIVAVDDRSLAEMGRFQDWHRDVYANLVDRLLSAKVVAFDLLFPEPDAGPGMSASKSDERFAAAMRKHGRVVLAAHWEEGGGQSGRSGAGDRERLQLPTRRLAEAAAGVGYVDLTPDGDGVYRRFSPQRVDAEGQAREHFGVVIARLAGARAEAGKGGTDRLINYCGPQGTVRRVSLVEVLKDPKVAESLAGKIVIVGATAPGLYDIRPAPYRSTGRLFYGVDMNANIVNTLTGPGRLVDRTGSWLWAAYAVLVGTLVTLVVWRAEETVAATLSILVVLALAVPSFPVALRYLGQVVPYGAILGAAVVPLVLGLPERLTAERRLIQRQFGAYVSPEVLRGLMSEPETLRSSQRQQVTLLFADVRGSTTLAEQTSPEVWVAQLNEYLTQMSRAIFTYDGYLDKFMGDGIMAVWNAFGTQEGSHAELAVRAGLQMLQRLEVLNRAWASREGRAQLRIGIGIHSGEAVVGNVGSEDRTQYTAIGDTVNTASRIEEMTKEYGVAFVVSEATAKLVGEQVTLRELGRAPVRGRSEGVGVYEVVGPGKATTPHSPALSPRHGNGTSRPLSPSPRGGEGEGKGNG
ncbi:MAG: adenylate/guanylate cyclase domain-containing protein [Armatimonadia bacterium]